MIVIAALVVDPCLVSALLGWVKLPWITVNDWVSRDVRKMYALILVAGCL